MMLDSGFNAKLGDFGLARLMDHELGPQTMGLAGTLGYMAPEYVRTGKASKESDAYIFGVVAIEICLDEKLKQDYDEEQAKRLMMVGLWCAHADRMSRPSIRQAIQVLNFEADVPDLSMNEPVIEHHASNNQSSSSGNPYLTSSSINIGR
ncbi:putative protein kinase RLK-Pelle-L-LEC family [Helianthus debilis subsp. tardiflorus]